MRQTIRIESAGLLRIIDIDAIAIVVGIQRAKCIEIFVLLSAFNFLSYQIKCKSFDDTYLRTNEGCASNCT